MSGPLPGSTSLDHFDNPIARVRSVREVKRDRPPSLIHEGWAERFSWLAQGTTTRGSREAPFDLGLFAQGASGDEVRRRWAELVQSTGLRTAAHARQVHGRRVVRHAGETAVDTLVRVVDAYDAHVTDQPGLLLAIATADCVPVSLVDARRRAIGMAHAGWRGTSAGVLEAALAALRQHFGTDESDLHLHFGPAICGECYEVGPEVFEALGLPAPARPEPLDLRAVLVARALAAGVPGDQISVSMHCTRCTRSGLFSHRGGDPHRQVGYLGIRDG